MNAVATTSINRGRARWGEGKDLSGPAAPHLPWALLVLQRGRRASGILGEAALSLLLLEHGTGGAMADHERARAQPKQDQSTRGQT